MTFNEWEKLTLATTTSERWWRNGETINIAECVVVVSEESRVDCWNVSRALYIDDVNDDGKAFFGLAQFRSLINFTVLSSLCVCRQSFVIVIFLLLPLLSSPSPFSFTQLSPAPRVVVAAITFILKFSIKRRMSGIGGVSCNFVPIILIFIIVYAVPFPLSFG